MLKRFAALVGLFAVITLIAAMAATADAGGQATITITQHAHNVPLFTQPVTNPCTGAPGTATAVASNEVFHVTFFTNGGDEFWVTGTDEGTITFTPDSPGVSATGHFASWFGESFNNKNDVQHDTFHATLTNTDGSHVVVSMVDHLSTNANGVVTQSFSNMKVACA